MSLDYLGSSNGINKGLDITANPNTWQNSGYSLDTRDNSHVTLNRSSSNQGIEQGDRNLSNRGTLGVQVSATTSNAIYVNQNATGGNDGSSWSNAYTDLQAALTSALAGDQIWVSKGTYKPTATTDRNASFSLKKFVSVYGGFGGYETNLSQRDWSNNLTILSGDIGTVGTRTDNSYHIVDFSNTTNTSILDGFTITGGYADYNNGAGAGIISTVAGNATLANLIIKGNIASDRGGGMYEGASNPTLTHVIFRENVANNYGGAMYNSGGNIKIINSIFYNNSSTKGGAIYNAVTNFQIINTTLDTNHSDYGGAIFNDSAAYGLNSDVTISNSIMWNNAGGVDGNQIVNFKTSQTTVTNSDVQGGYTGTSNINVDPLFVDEANGDLRLQFGSPVINKGNNAALPSDEVTDFAGNPRIVGGTVDLGAFEVQAATSTITVTASDPNAAETLPGLPTNPGVYTFTRTGDTTNPLTVKYALSGTATNAVDSNNLGTSIVIPIGQISVTLTLNPIDDNLLEGNETAILTLVSDLAYTIGTANNATITIADNDSNVSPTPNDFNSDGKTDLVWRNYATGQNAAWFMNGTTFSGAQLLQSTPDINWHIEGTGDFNNDGKSDLVWRNYATGENAVWFMNGTNFSGAQYLQSTPDLNWHIEGTGDFNNDGKSDLLWRNYATGQNAVWFMNGTTFSGAQYLQSTPDLNWHIEGTGDFNNDGKSDLLWRNYATGENAVWFMNGTTFSGAQFLQAVGDSNWHIQGAGDFNSDSRPDLVWRNYATGENAMWRMNGTTLAGAQFFQAVADINWEIVGT